MHILFKRRLIELFLKKFKTKILITKIDYEKFKEIRLDACGI